MKDEGGKDEGPAAVGVRSDSPVIGKSARKSQPFDLEERTARFAEAIVRFAKRIPLSPTTRGPVGQLVDAGTSIGANYCEADDAFSRKDFRHCIGVCRKEARETKYWLRVIATAVPELKSEARTLWTEAKELHLIFSKAFRTVSKGGLK